MISKAESCFRVPSVWPGAAAAGSSREDGWMDVTGPRATVHGAFPTAPLRPVEGAQSLLAAVRPWRLVLLTPVEARGTSNCSEHNPLPLARRELGAVTQHSNATQETHSQVTPLEQVCKRLLPSTRDPGRTCASGPQAAVILPVPRGAGPLRARCPWVQSQELCRQEGRSRSCAPSSPYLSFPPSPAKWLGEESGRTSVFFLSVVLCRENISWITLLI
ncbi:Hypothetical predicted protein [Marmota monax]|uniref:Uncharacterized protein n=1 Tax=Marmota monax TaxID=9995 RepID=A0A5E4A3N2_MARMO|nr:Hypothetical predicted protein [Marmota monax]